MQQTLEAIEMGQIKRSNFPLFACYKKLTLDWKCHQYNKAVV